MIEDQLFIVQDEQRILKGDLSLSDTNKRDNNFLLISIGKIIIQTLSQKEKTIPMADSQINKIHNNILSQISKIYDQYEQKSRQMKQQSNKKTGSTIEKAQSDLIKKLQTILQPELQKLLNQMEKVKMLKGRYSGPVKNCHNTIKSILKKKSFNFKINKQFNQLYDETLTAIKLIKEKIPMAQKTTFLCCGTDGQKEIQTVINLFKIQSGKWEMIETLEPKGSVDNYICPQFSENDYDFIKQLIKANWPKEKEAEVKQVVKEVIREVKVPEKIVQKVYINVGDKSDRLGEANQHLFGINREENPLRGLEIYHEEADKNQNAQACAFLARAYELGALLPKNMAKSASYYQRAVEKKHKYATYRFAILLIKGMFTKDKNDKSKKAEDVKRGYNLLKEITAGQDPCAQALAELGMLFQNGYFVADSEKVQVQTIDLKKAISYNEKAKGYDLPRAINNLGLIYYNNKSMNPSNPNQKIQSEPVKVQNTKRALTYFLQAQKHGYPEAYYNLGVIHKEERQGQKAIKFFYQGARKGDYLSKIKFAYELMNQTSIEKQQFQDHYRLAQHWLEEVIQHLNLIEAEAGAPDIIHRHQLEKAQTMFYMGLFYEHGFGVEKSPKRAFNYFLQSSQLSYPPAKNKIGDCYFSGYAVPPNRQLAIGCYLESQALGDSDAMVNLGTIYLNGIPGVIQRNYSKAHEYFCKSMELQNSDAMIHLSYMYRNGLGLDQDDGLAKKLLEQAAKNKNSTALYMLKERGQDFNKNIYYDNLENQFPFVPKKIDISQVIPVISAL